MKIQIKPFVVPPEKESSWESIKPHIVSFLNEFVRTSARTEDLSFQQKGVVAEVASALAESLEEAKILKKTDTIVRRKELNIFKEKKKGKDDASR